MQPLIFAAQIKSSTVQQGETIRQRTESAWSLHGDANKSLRKDLTCDPKCVDPDPVPPEYAEDPENGWVCAEGFVGNVSTECEVAYPADWVPNCTAVLNLTGCAPLEPCAPVVVEDAEMFDDNTDAEQPPLIVGEPSCRLACDAAPALRAMHLSGASQATGWIRGVLRLSAIRNWDEKGVCFV
ncbi:unnamed protein product [Symbiodinium natans]|uniref:Uncharacterized protein n=1 Tax=Symbiodinium natans TaxID=878477 RepID=A0A812IIK3_9DINO|nr:unnamed protein product [Symbiodinium natans]